MQRERRRKRDENRPYGAQMAQSLSAIVSKNWRKNENQLLGIIELTGYTRHCDKLLTWVFLFTQISRVKPCCKAGDTVSREATELLAKAAGEPRTL